MSLPLLEPVRFVVLLTYDNACTFGAENWVGEPKLAHFNLYESKVQIILIYIRGQAQVKILNIKI